MISPEKIDAMQAAWVRLMAPCGATPADVYPLFDELLAKYTEAHRHYHTFEHLADMFRVAGRLANSTTNMTAIQFAIWFHDAIYDPKATDNEAQSAAWMRQSLAPFGWPSDLLHQVEALILATAKHQPSTNPDTMIFLDADLAILSADQWKYDRYASAIRQEYAWLTDAEYRQGRTRVLQQFLARDQIYLTPIFQDLGHLPARDNLNRELRTLSS